MSELNNPGKYTIKDPNIGNLLKDSTPDDFLTGIEVKLKGLDKSIYSLDFNVSYSFPGTTITYDCTNSKGSNQTKEAVKKEIIGLIGETQGFVHGEMNSEKTEFTNNRKAIGFKEFLEMVAELQYEAMQVEKVIAHVNEKYDYLLDFGRDINTSVNTK